MDDQFLQSSKSKKTKKSDPKAYAAHIATTVKWTYISAIVLWIILIIFFCFYKTTYFGYMILALPVVIYIIGFLNASGTVESDDAIYACNYLSIGLLVVLPLLTWLDKKENAHKTAILEAMIIAIILLMLSLIDVWVKPQWLSVVKHIKSIFQTASLTLLIYALYMFYMGRDNGIYPRQSQ